ncbi:tRNA (adenosine(37)-N6)-threonylcarbamoyltransferase complex ATPase subunit type 1 TsaE [Myroides sp. JBRI-B21084]|uniref:tRNA (adenosine(37)-N6)-threonylcarbamoyltransferase complex ATPase subunit type 1 TsaE n=1 Tax=Myroides sp. JBRI-B21084 TaxID=3119977 RepID=UPI0026E319D5|nr:tRNA (adenosine(37)-N6)-threonylcarbamoyltransferase complex ATPase subunit type 1 TsaE [Paenimyroides cloacae]WKW45604.1 tRNA (adenosine(37)-N6)-threonylcarbamoyltransferase complex ATPase subunit type 1 TsaE [Paenimyroides cloacae]
MTFTYNLNDINKIAKALIANSKHKTWLFNAPMGAGKTTLIKALANNLGVTDMANSPTFSIVNEYVAHENKVYHFDLYRLKNDQEVYDMGLDEYFYENAWCFVEWPEMAESILPNETHVITITIIDEYTRTLKFE